MRFAAKNSPINAGLASCFIALLSALASLCPVQVLLLILNSKSHESNGKKQLENRIGNRPDL